MKTQPDNIEAYREDILFDRRENVQRHMSYTHEQIRHRIIKEGRVDLIQQALLENYQKMHFEAIKICLLPLSPGLPGMLLKEVCRKKSPLL